MQDLDVPGLPWTSVVANVHKSIVLAPVVQLVQAASMVSCLVLPAVGFAVIEKA